MNIECSPTHILTTWRIPIDGQQKTVEIFSKILCNCEFYQVNFLLYYFIIRIKKCLTKIQKHSN